MGSLNPKLIKTPLPFLGPEVKTRDSHSKVTTTLLYIISHLDKQEVPGDPWHRRSYTMYMQIMYDICGRTAGNVRGRGWSKEEQHRRRENWPLMGTEI